jgi:FKBP-type peptidyl-prolyl cis-trans isomerase
MKKSILLIVVALSVFSSYSCSQISSNNAKLTTAEDSLAYAFGVAVAQDIKNNFDLEEVNTKALSKGADDALNEEGIMNKQEAQMFIRDYYGKSLQKAEDALMMENSKKDSVITLPSGLQYKVITMGEGPKPVATDKVSTYYKGTLFDGTQFDASPEGQPVDFHLNRVIKGWTEGIQLMPVGSKWVLYVPSALGYGPQGVPNSPIGPFTPLVFEVELLDIIKEEHVEGDGHDHSNHSH